MSRGSGLINLQIDEQRILSGLDNSTTWNTYAKRRAELVVATAIAVFEAKKVKGPWRESATSPPRYAESFAVRKMGRTWLVINTDPGAMWVEFGARAGGTTPVLKYRPLGTAIDILTNEVT